MDIQVILTENDPKLGKRGQVIKVSSGYAHNFLFPNGKAMPATNANLKNLEAEKARTAKHDTEVLDQARALAAKIGAVKLRLDVMAGDQDKLFGAVTAQDISDALSAKAIALDRKKIHLEEPLKKLGVHQIEIRLHPQVIAQLSVELVKK